MTQSLLQVLQQHPFVAEFRPEHTQRLAALANKVQFAEGQVPIIHTAIRIVSDGFAAETPIDIAPIIILPGALSPRPCALSSKTTCRNRPS